jgi:hypothetical protein
MVNLPDVVAFLGGSMPQQQIFMKRREHYAGII